MGLLDRFKKEKKTEEELKQEYFDKGVKEIENYLDNRKKQSEKEINDAIRINNEIEGRLRQLDNAPGQVKARNVAAEEADKMLKEFKKRDFEKKYEKIKTLRTAIISKEELGITPNYAQKELKNYYLIPEIGRKILFYAYLYEKQELGIITEAEKQELTKIIKENNSFKEEEIITGSLTYLQMIDVINIEDEETFPKSFLRVKDHSRGEIKNLAQVNKDYNELKYYQNSFKYDGQPRQTSEQPTDTEHRSRH